MRAKILVTLMLSVEMCAGILYHVNDTMHDSFPLMFGLDDYYRCLRIPNARYCLAKYSLSEGNNKELMDILKEYTEHKVKHFNYTYIERGTCVSSRNCNKFSKGKDVNLKKDLEQILEACVNETIYETCGLEAKLDKVYSCDNKEQQQIDTYDWVVAGCLAALILISTIGSLYHWVLYMLDDEKAMANERSLLLCFSIYQNWLHLVAPTPTDPRTARLKGFHGIKSVATFMIIIPHALWIIVSYIDNPHDFETNYEIPYYQMLNNGLVIVQTFFLISGFLLVYNLEVYADNHKVNWLLFPKVMFLRWWRLTPSNAVVIAFSATWMRHIGSGPLWNQNISNSVTADCRKYWWSHIFYFNNYIPDDLYCVLQSWYIAVDTQLFSLGLLVFLATRSRGRAPLLAVLMLLGLLAPALHIWLQDLDGVVVLTPEFQRSLQHAKDFIYIYKPGHNNLPCYIIGMAIGYLVVHWRRSGYDLSKNKLVAQLTWCVIPLVAAVFYSGRFLYADGPRPPLPARILYGVSHRVLLGVIIGYGMVAIVMKFDVALRKIFEWRGWVVPSRLSYCIYLVHVNVIQYIVATKTTLYHVSTFTILYNHLGVSFVSFLLAWPLYLLVEAPFNKLMKIVFHMEQHHYQDRDPQRNDP